MRYRAEMDDQIAGVFLRVAHGELAAGRGEHRAGVALLAAGFAVERRLVGDDGGLRAGLRLAGFRAANDDRRDLAFGDMGVVAEEFGRAELVTQLEPQPLGRRLA